ncbi:MAG TPA: hypothetical protein VMT08_29780 [Bradyrhizobium sp.]|nr:hypothetical protein [Bradyrhizobium sp.]
MPVVVAVLVETSQQGAALNDDCHINSLKTIAVVSHNFVMCRVADADQHCEKYPRLPARRGAIF